jgi:type I restriction enzyme S subunit
MISSYKIKLPDGWVNTSLFNISKKLKAGGTPSTTKKEYYENGTIPFVKIEDMVNSNKYLYSTKINITYDGLNNSAAWIVPKNSLLYSMYASYGEAIINKIDVATNQAIIAYVPPDNQIDLDYIYYYLKYIKSQLVVKGTTQLNLNADIVKNISILLPPLVEQHRIVAKVEELITKLDSGVESLKRAKVKLKQYRYAILRKAFNGQLTEEWRASHQKEADLFIPDYKKGDHAIGSYYNPPSVWSYTTISKISDLIQYGTSEKATEEHIGIPVIRMGNITDGQINFDKLKYFNKDESFINDFLLNDGDVLFNRTNSAELVGKTAVYKKSYPRAVFASYLIRVKVKRELYNPDFLSYFINSSYGRNYIKSVVTQQVGQANVNGTKLSQMGVPFTSLNEQNLIVKEIESRFSIIDESEKTIDQNLSRSETLRQSILALAFSGKLAPQDPDDEPAGKLLERIHAEKASVKAIMENGKNKNNRTGMAKTVEQSTLV